MLHGCSEAETPVRPLGPWVLAAAFWPKDLYQPTNNAACVFKLSPNIDSTSFPPEQHYPFKACVKSQCSGTLNWSAVRVCDRPAQC